MELKKVSINILHPLSISQKVGVQLNNEDIDKNIKGFHLEIVNKVKKTFLCNCFFESQCKLSYSFTTKLIDKKTSLAIEFNYHKIKFQIDEFETKHIYIFLDNIEEDFELETPIFFTKFQTEDEENYSYNIEKLELETIENNDEFKQIFGFDKKYHFDQYRFYVLMLLVNENNTILIGKILKNAKTERDYLLMSDEGLFYQLVYKNLLEEDIGEQFKDYKTCIMQKLKIYVKDLSLLIEKKESKIVSERTNVFEEGNFKMRKKINFRFNEEVEFKNIDEKQLQDNKITNYKEHFELETKNGIKNINGVNFSFIQYQRKGFYFEPHFSIIILGEGDCEITLENLLKEDIGYYFEIILFGGQGINESMFKNFDKLFRIKIINAYQKIGKVVKLSNIQKLIVMSQFIKNTSEILFIGYINSIFPKKYFYEGLKQKNKDKIYCVSKCDMFNNKTGLIVKYEVNRNYEFLSECMFPMFYMEIFTKLNFTMNIFGLMETLKDFRKFLIKNGNIIGIDYLKTQGGLSIFEI